MTPFRYLATTGTRSTLVEAILMHTQSGIIVIDFDDVIVFHTAQEATEWMEPIDVQQIAFEVLDQVGNRFQPAIREGSIVLLPVESDKYKDQLSHDKLQCFIQEIFPNIVLPEDLSGACKTVVHQMLAATNGSRVDSDATDT